MRLCIQPPVPTSAEPTTSRAQVESCTFPAVAFLLAAFGQVSAPEWARQKRSLGDLGSDRACRGSDWHDAGGVVRLAVVNPKGAPIGPPRMAHDIVAAAVGRIDSNQADAAVAVLDAYGRGGSAGLASLCGEFAYALWDGRERALFTGCDAVGLQAPAYCWNGRAFRMSTRALALLGGPDVPCAFEPVYLAHALSGLWSNTASATAFQGVHRMIGGELIRVSARGLERLDGARLRFHAPRTRRREGAVGQLGEVLDGAVAQDIESGTSCVALSGGVDSFVVAASLARQRPEFAAISLVAPDSCPGDARVLSPLVAAFPGIRLDRVQLTGASELVDRGALGDDPVCAGPVLQPGRATLLRTARDLGFRRVYTGEGGDEIFDLAWRLGDLVRQATLRGVLSTLRSRVTAAQALYDVIAGGRGPLSKALLERAKKLARKRRPWLRAAFWESPSFVSAWRELAAYGRLRSASERMPEILGSHGRYWRAQELARLSVGIEGSSPLVSRAVVELTASLRAETAIDTQHSKVLLRQLAAQRAPSPVAWRPKQEALSQWLGARWIADDANATRVVSQIKRSESLAPLVDPAVVVAAIDAARGLGGTRELPSSLVELAAVVEWVTAVEARWGA